MKNLKVNSGNEHDPVFQKNQGHNQYNQLAVKIDMDNTQDDTYFKWLDKIILETPKFIPGTKFLEKTGVP